MGKRRKGREVLLQAGYASLVGGAPLERCLEDQLARREAAPETVAFARELAARLAAHAAETDRWLAGLLEHWDPERVGAVERVILRIALTELRHSPTVPWRAVINEACELARRYADDEAVRFVNGVLDRAAAEQLRAEGGAGGGAAGTDGDGGAGPGREEGA